MLSVKFVNCYGIKEFELEEINFSNQNNKAIIYAPNGVMKTSFANVFRDIAKGEATKDRIFKDLQSSYVVKYYSSNYSNTSLSKNENIYVVQSFDETFIPSNESVGILLADEKTRKDYDILMNQISGELTELMNNLSNLSGFKPMEIEKILKKDFELGKDADWYDILSKVKKFNLDENNVELLSNIKYSRLLNEKTEAIIQSKDFLELINNYTSLLNNLLNKNEFLSKKFNDYNAEDLGKSLKKNNLFANNHSILLNDGTQINTLQQWNSIVDEQLKEIYNDATLKKALKDLTKKLTSNDNVRNLREIILENPAIINYLSDINKLKKLLWISYINNLEKDFELYFQKLSEYSERIKKLYETASQQSERWNKVVSEFNRRFKVPFEVKIENKANFLLKDEAPNLYFEYTRCKGTDEQKIERCQREDLMKSLSMGEKRAMYLLYILFDLEALQRKAVQGNGKYLIILDDIADSFDYKNKYAIIEYLADVTKNEHIDTLILTHNFDFYRTVTSRLNISRNNSFIVQKKDDESLEMSKLQYRNDYFSKCIVEAIKDGNISTDEKKIKLVASIPFYRNLAEYMLLENDKLNLTCLLHIKDNPMNTMNLELSDVWNMIPNSFRNSFGTLSINGNNEIYIDLIRRLAQKICNTSMEDVVLENKIVLSIAIRLELEIFLKQVLVVNNISLECSSVQTRVWSKLAKPFLSDEQVAIVDEVNLMTPESIHLNSFMYEPIIDMSDWALKTLYQEVLNISNK